MLFLESNVILTVLKESNQYFLKVCTHHTPYTLPVKTILVRKVFSICKHCHLETKKMQLLGGCAPIPPASETHFCVETPFRKSWICPCMVPKILQYAMSQVSVHQSAALNCVRGEYHHVMYCMQAED